MSDLKGKIPLTDLAGVLYKNGHTKKKYPYNRLYHAVLGARFPAEKGDNGRWYIDHADCPLVVQAMERQLALETAN